MSKVSLSLSVDTVFLFLHLRRSRFDDDHRPHIEPCSVIMIRNIQDTVRKEDVSACVLEYPLKYIISPVLQDNYSSLNQSILCIQWNLSKADTIGTNKKIVRYREGVLWSGVYYTLCGLYLGFSRCPL